MIHGLIAVALVWVLVFGLFQSSKPFAGVLYKGGKAPPWPSHGLTAGTVTGLVACVVGMGYRRRNELFGEELLGIAIVVLAAGLCAVANRWFFKRWW
ncbi:MAG: hypothetical protein KKG14_09180 [Alphaproteobacteria bacterium]|nr:hypothetical protein [Alphaproteobacteria bacterium]